jgi:hypothetical protein
MDMHIRIPYDPFGDGDAAWI